MERRPAAARRLLALLLLAGCAHAQAIVSAHWLRRHRGQAAVIAAAPLAVFIHGHIPGAVRFEGAAPPAAKQIVVYQYAGFPIAAARVFARLDALGAGNRTAILNGGWGAWVAAGGAMETGTGASGRAPGRPVAEAAPHGVFVGRGFVAAHLHRADVLLLDARLPAYYSGARVEIPGERPGHIPGAANLPFTALVTRDGYFRSRAVMAAAFRRAGAHSSQLLIVYCHSGRKAAVVFLAARLLGFRARYYAGSWLDWSRP